MITLVLGAGVIGLATAYALHRDGIDLHIVERLDGPGMATSFGNAGGLCPGFAGPWAAPGMVAKALGWLLEPEPPLKIRPSLDPKQWAWLLAFARACDPGRSAANKRAMQAIAHYSLDQLAALVEETGVSFDHGKGGVLQIFRSEQTLAAAERAADVLTEFGINHRLVEAGELARIEPSLAGSPERLAGGLHLPDDQTGDCAAFCRSLAEWLANRGVRFSFGLEATRILQRSGRFSALETTRGAIEAERLVVCAGPFANRLLAPLRSPQPVYPVKGYSLTYTLTKGQGAPSSSVMDEDSKLMFTRLGNRLRVGGVAELAGFDASLNPRRLSAIERQAQGLFPQLASLPRPEPWAGLRPMTPDGRARIGPVPALKGLWLNVGHGSNGWTQAAGAGQLLADLVAGRPPAIDAAPYRPG